MKRKWILLGIWILVAIFVLLDSYSENRKEIERNEQLEANYVAAIANNEVVGYRPELIRTMPAEIRTVSIPTEKWKAKNPAEIFGFVNWNKKEYVWKKTTVSKEQLESKLGETTITVEETLLNKINYKKKITVYKIKDLREDAVIAVKFKNDAQYYVYINKKYRPATLGELMEDLNLKDTAVLGDIWYTVTKRKVGVGGECTTYYFEVEGEKIWELLLQNATVPNEKEDNLWHKEGIDIPFDLPLFGYEGVDITLHKDGYLTTRVFEKKQSFNIGKEAVENFMNDVFQNYPAYTKKYDPNTKTDIKERVELTEKTIKLE